ncbi:MAG: radical SAM protein [Deltaproteobacteria bacterium]|nr:radical SAM protein [Deltaproteobacteria bacterium]
MKISEIFTSIQGESTFCGLPCTFIRVAGCNLRCKYCDTTYALEGGEELELDQILSRVRDSGISLVELTGGEPLIQDECYLLVNLLLEEGYAVLLETNGDFDWARKIIDRYRIVEKCKVLVSPVFSKMEAKKLASWIIEERLPVRLQLQLHKFIWPDMNRGV